MLNTSGIFQMDLFEEDYSKHYDKGGYRYDIPAIDGVTFLNGLSEPVHRWFRLTPSYSPELVRYLAKDLNCSRELLLCDPFTGKGTTIIEAKKLGLRVVGIEINPVLKLASESALTWDVDVARFSSHFKKILNKLIKVLDGCRQMPIESVLEEFNLSLPKIHNVFRWWRSDVLKDLLLIKDVLKRVRDKNYQKLYWMALCSSCLDCANIHRNHPTISFDDNSIRDIDALKEFKEKVNNIIVDLQTLPKGKFGDTRMLLGDSTKIGELELGCIDRVITSPPYPNRVSYVHTTRAQLFFMDLIDSATEATDLDCSTIGGTWGRATSILEKGIIEPNPKIAEILQPTIADLRPKNNLMCNYAVKYFNLMDDHIRSLREVVNDDFRGAYVVGNSTLSGVEIITETLLAQIFSANGFKVDKILVFRKRGGRKKLYETGVCIKCT